MTSPVRTTDTLHVRDVLYTRTQGFGCTTHCFYTVTGFTKTGRPRLKCITPVVTSTTRTPHGTHTKLTVDGGSVDQTSRHTAHVKDGCFALKPDGHTTALFYRYMGGTVLENTTSNQW